LPVARFKVWNPAKTVLLNGTVEEIVLPKHRIYQRYLITEMLTGVLSIKH
jgi:hypothetical protein